MAMDESIVDLIRQRTDLISAFKKISGISLDPGKDFAANFIWKNYEGRIYHSFDCILDIEIVHSPNWDEEMALMIESNGGDDVSDDDLESFIFDQIHDDCRCLFKGTCFDWENRERLPNHKFSILYLPKTGASWKHAYLDLRKIVATISKDAPKSISLDQLMALFPNAFAEQTLK